MNRKTLTDGSRRWFDADSSDELGGFSTEQGGIKHTETVYHTKSGLFMLEKETYGNAMDNQRECEEIAVEEAAAFLADHGFALPEWMEHLSGGEL